MGIVPGGDTIGSWTTSRLLKVIRDDFQNNPPKFLGNLSVEDMTVTKTLTLEDGLEATKSTGFKLVGGGSGQPPFTNSWGNVGGSFLAAGYWKDVLGIVHLQGRIAAGTVGSAAFTLPPGIRPSATISVPVISNDAIGRLDIGADGTVTPKSPSSNVYVSLDGITFKV